jgi:15,16-dihydrobiliverdin:ferredoxin oxidoreductase
MDDFLKKALETIEKKLVLESVSLPAELQHISVEPAPEVLAKIHLPPGKIEIHLYNWKSEKIRKMYFMRLTSGQLFLDIAGLGMFPHEKYDFPILSCDFNGMGPQVLPMINFAPLNRSDAYMNNYIEPMKVVHEKYRQYPRTPSSPFLEPYLVQYGIFSKVDKNNLEGLKQCGLDYLSLYVDLVAKAAEIQNPVYQQEIKRTQTKFIDDLVTNDPSRMMLGQLIGQDKADRIFKEVVTGQGY